MRWVVNVALVLAAVCAEDGVHGPYLWSYQETADGRTEPRKIPVDDSSQAWFRRLVEAETQLRKGRLGEAHAAYEAILGMFDVPMTETLNIHMNLGHILTNFSLYEEAEISFQHAASASTMAEFRSVGYLPPFALSIVYTKQGQLTEAREALETSLFFRPTFVPALYNLGALHFMQGNVEQGLHFMTAALDRFLKHDPPIGLDPGPISLGEARDTLPWLQAQLLQAFYQQPPQLPRGFLTPSDGIERSEFITWAGSHDPPAFAQRLHRFLRFFEQLEDERFALHMNLGIALQNVGAATAADAHLQIAATRRPAEAWIAWHRFLSLPLVAASADEARRDRARLSQRTRSALAGGWRPHQPDRLRDLYFVFGPLFHAPWPSRHLVTDLALLAARSEDPILGHVAPRLQVQAMERWLEFGRSPPSQPTEEGHGGGVGDARGGGGEEMWHAVSRVDSERLAPWESALLLPEGDTAARRMEADQGGRVVRVGVVSYQLYDCSVGHFLRRLMRHLRLYGRRKELHRKRAYPAQGRWLHNAPVVCSHRDAPPPIREEAEAETGGGWWDSLLNLFRSSAPMPSSDGKSGGARKETVGEGERARRIHPAECLRRASSWGGGTTHDRPGWTWVRVREKGDRAAEETGGEEDGEEWEAALTFVEGVDRFHVTLGLLRPYGDRVTQAALKEADEVVRLDRTTHREDGTTSFRDLDFARLKLEAAELDVLVVADNGLDAFVWSLMQNRVAPHQLLLLAGGSGAVTTFGLPDTVDYVVTGDAVAAASLDERTAEQTVRLGDGGVFLPPLPAVREEEFLETVRSLSLLSSRRYYFCPRVLGGLDAGFDEVIGAILRLDPAAEVLLLYEAEQELWREKFRRRLMQDKAVKGAIARVRFFRFLPRKRLWSVMLASSVVLDPFPSGLGVSGLEALSLGVPVLTLPGRQPGRQLVRSALQRMGVPELIFSGRNATRFAERAVELAINENAQAELRSHLRRRSSALQWDDSWLASQKKEKVVDVEKEDWQHRQQLRRLGWTSPSTDTLDDWLTFVARITQTDA